MKKMALVLFMVLALSGAAFAQQTITLSPGAHDNVNANASATILPGAVVAPITNIYTPVNVFTPTNLNSNIQGQLQGQNNDQVIAPVQVTDITFNAPKIPRSVAVETPPQVNPTPELNYIDPEEHDVTMEFAKIGNFDRFDPKKDEIVDVLYKKGDQTFADLYETVIKGGKDDKVKSLVPANVRYQIWGQKSARSRQAGLGLGGNATGMIQTTGTGGSLGLGFTQGTSTSKKKFTVKYLLIQTPEKERKSNIETYEKKAMLGDGWKKVEDKSASK